MIYANNFTALKTCKCDCCEGTMRIVMTQSKEIICFKFFSKCVNFVSWTIYYLWSVDSYRNAYRVWKMRYNFDNLGEKLSGRCCSFSITSHSFSKVVMEETTG